jgi:hypothetical protein
MVWSISIWLFISCWQVFLPVWIDKSVAHVLEQFNFACWPFVKINWLDFCDMNSKLTMHSWASDNNMCAECYSKIPRWASITFGTFMVIRCSGVHRQLGVHITKVKSVNLDKWPAGKVELF